MNFVQLMIRRNEVLQASVWQPLGFVVTIAKMTESSQSTGSPRRNSFGNHLNRNEMWRCSSQVNLATEGQTIDLSRPRQPRFLFLAFFARRFAGGRRAFAR